jgi:glycosyltransferase involved in cell wall biosynthesis
MHEEGALEGVEKFGLGRFWEPFWRFFHSPSGDHINFSYVTPRLGMEKSPQTELYNALSEQKPFVFVIYAHNALHECERMLRSIFAQEYDRYRVVWVDDASSDASWAKVEQFIIDNHQDQKTILIRSEERVGPVGALYRAAAALSAQEILIPLDAKDWLTRRDLLQELNRAYQDPHLWALVAPALMYPSYVVKPDGFVSFYLSLFRQLRLEDLFARGSFLDSPRAYVQPIVELAAGHSWVLSQPLLFWNMAKREAVSSLPISHRAPLVSQEDAVQRVSPPDILLFSFDRPMQLYACLESIACYMSHFAKISVIYRVSSERFAQGYEEVKRAFPQVDYYRQSEDPKRDFKPLVLRILFDSPAPHILFGVDDLIVKDDVDLASCVDWLERTGAYGFYLRLGKEIRFCYQSGSQQSVPQSAPLSSGIFAWDIPSAQGDWGFPHNLDMTLFRKRDLKHAFETMRYKTPNSLEYIWANEHAPKRAIGLYFEHAKVFNLPLNVVGKTGNPHMNFASPEALLTEFEKGWKIDIAPFDRINNDSPHFPVVPRFVPRS